MKHARPAGVTPASGSGSAGNLSALAAHACVGDPVVNPAGGPASSHEPGARQPGLAPARQPDAALHHQNFRPRGPRAAPRGGGRRGAGARHHPRRGGGGGGAPPPRPPPPPPPPRRTGRPGACPRPRAGANTLAAVSRLPSEVKPPFLASMLYE